MADTLTPNVLLTNQTEGGNNNTWGQIADANFELIDNKFGDTTDISTTGGTTTLTDSQELVASIQVADALVSNATIVFSGRGGFWIVDNNTTGSFTLTCKVSGQTGVVVEQGSCALIFCDGTDILLGNPPLAAVAEVTVASAATCNILAAASEFVAISGTTTITSFGTGVNTKRFVRATGAFKITHHATSLILPGGQDLTTAAGDTFIVISDASSNCRIYAYQRAANPPATVPIGASIDYFGATAPAFYIFPYGQLLSRTTYAALFAVLSTTFGVGDGSTTFGVPDLRGRVVAGKDDMGGSSANRLTNQSGGLNGDTLGATGGSETVTIAQANLPNIAPTFAGDVVGNHTHSVPNDSPTGSGNLAQGGDLGSPAKNSGGSGGHTPSGTISSINGGVAQTAMNIVQPTIVANKILYVGVV
jgi:microcystin-dependent protein